MSETKLLPLDAFFDRYPLFLYNRAAGVSDEWCGLCKTYRWRAGDQDKSDAYEGYKDTLAQQFNALYGQSYYEFEAWRAMCKTMGIDPLPSGWKDAYKAVMRKHVNLIDLVDAHGSGATITTFSTAAELDEYTRRTYKFFPVKNPHNGELAKVLLRRLDFASSLAPVKSAGEKLADEVKVQKAPDAKKRRAVAQEIDAILDTGKTKRARGVPTREGTNEAKSTKTAATKEPSVDPKGPVLTTKKMNAKEPKTAPQPPTDEKGKIKDTPLQAQIKREARAAKSATPRGGVEIGLNGKKRVATVKAPVGHSRVDKRALEKAEKAAQAASKLDQKRSVLRKRPDTRRDGRKGDVKALINEGRRTKAASF